jgi:hypothetical protein
VEVAEAFIIAVGAFRILKLAARYTLAWGLCIMAARSGRIASFKISPNEI